MALAFTDTFFYFLESTMLSPIIYAIKVPHDIIMLAISLTVESGTLNAISNGVTKPTNAAKNFLLVNFLSNSVFISYLSFYFF